MKNRKYENISVYNISYKTLIGEKPFCVKVDGIIRVFDGTRYSVLFGQEKCDAIYNRIKYLIIKINVCFLS